jgi:hypothetical protein
MQPQGLSAQSAIRNHQSRWHRRLTDAVMDFLGRTRTLIGSGTTWVVGATVRIENFRRRTSSRTWLQDGARNRTPTPPPFSGMNSIPASSKAFMMRSIVPLRRSSPRSRRTIVCVETLAALARSSTPHASAVRAILHWIALISPYNGDFCCSSSLLPVDFSHNGRTTCWSTISGLTTTKLFGSSDHG